VPHDNFFASAPPTGACEACVYGSGDHRSDCVVKNSPAEAALRDLRKVLEEPGDPDLIRRLIRRA
jgi:hypothetical protein